MYSGQIFFRDAYLGEVTYHPKSEDYEWQKSSLAYFCVHCGEIWGRIVMHDRTGRQQSFRPLSIACPEHHDYYNIPGSFLADHVAYLLPQLPLAAMQREFILHLHHYEKHYEHSTHYRP